MEFLPLQESNNSTNFMGSAALPKVCS